MKTVTHHVHKEFASAVVVAMAEARPDRCAAKLSITQKSKCPAYHKAGSYDITFDGSRLPDGVYLYCLKIDNKSRI
jgi:hypothetical protein